MMKNDLAFILAGTINMYEHQSTYNANMPLRFLIYLAQEYQNLMEQVEQGLYGSRQIPLPTPQCVVFYNGTQREPEEQILNLSDAFLNKDREAMENAIQYCIEQGILAETLTKYRAEVLGMILEEFDREKYEHTIRADGFEDGREEGIEIGQERVNRLNQILVEQNRIEDLKQSAQNPEYQELLFKEFDI